MSVSMTRSDGVTVLTMTSDPASTCPPLCQILQTLCYSPVCCSVSQKLRSLLGTSHSALGTLQVMVGVMNICLGSILCSSGPASTWLMDFTGFPFWLGMLFIIFGILCILSEKFPSPCLVASSVSAQLSGIAFSITAVVLYSSNMIGMYFGWICEEDYYHYRRWESAAMPTQASTDQQECLDGLSVIKMVLGGINVLLIILSVLQLCVSISCAVLGIKALKKSLKKEEKGEDLESYSPLLAEKPAY